MHSAGSQARDPAPSPRRGSLESDEQRVAELVEVDRDGPNQKPGVLRTVGMRTTPTAKG